MTVMTIRNQKSVNKGRDFLPASELTSRRMKLVKYKHTEPELILRKYLWAAGVRGYRLHWKKVPGRPDIAFVNKKIAVFIHGCFWHQCPHCKPNKPKRNATYWQTKFDKNVERDLRNVGLLTKLNWQTITVWECQIKSNVDGCISSICKALNIVPSPDRADILP